MLWDYEQQQYRFMLTSRHGDVFALLPVYLLLSYLLHWDFLLSGAWWNRSGSWCGRSCLTQFTREQGRTTVCVRHAVVLWSVCAGFNLWDLCTTEPFYFKYQSAERSLNYERSTNLMYWQYSHVPLRYLLMIKLCFSCKEIFRNRIYNIKLLGQTWCIWSTSVSR